MFKLLSLAFAVLIFSGRCSAQNVTLSIVRLGCGAPLSPLFSPPKSLQEREEIAAEWVGPEELAVDAWGDETADSQVDPGSAKVHLDGTTVTVSYSRKSVVLERSKPIPDCQFLAKLFFTVAGLPRSHYQLRIDDGHHVHQLAIDG